MSYYTFATVNFIVVDAKMLPHDYVTTISFNY